MNHNALIEERGANKWRRQVQSATYYLVWHKGMTIADAEDLLAEVKASIPDLAKRGSVEFNKCSKALCAWIDRIESKGKVTWEWIK